MPTPSSPDSRISYSFPTTCPDTDDDSPSRDDTPVSLSAHAIHHSAMTEDDATPASPDTSSVSHYEDADGPVLDLDPDASTSSSTAEHSSSPEPIKSPESNSNQTRAHRTQSSAERTQILQPRHGVGTSPASSCRAETDALHCPQNQPERAMEHDYKLPSMGYGYPSQRVIPISPSSFLRAGSRFTGTQQSERQVYDVQVEIKYVNLQESFLCGYLRIQGLTDDHPTLTTYFEGEVIGAKYGFMTKHESWGANDKTDLSHWSKFPAFRPYSKQARKGSTVVISDISQCEHIFMRWKEHFLVPDHRVRTITGASFEGFYYICFNQVQGEVNGIYFHSKSEKFQQLELKHVQDKGCLSALEFR